MRVPVLASLLLVAPLAGACATIAPPGKTPVAVADETAVIVWDPATRTERFVRTATFTGADGPMAFLVPTPTPPTLEAAPELGPDWPRGALYGLRMQVAPRIDTYTRSVYRLSRGWDLWPREPVQYKGAKPAGMGGRMVAFDPAPVTVLARERVGGYDTAVLRAGDPGALFGWLKAAGFATDARTERWLRPYTKKGWAITAFRFRPSGRTFATEPVCLTFQTDRPFYPYREPAGARAPATRSLRVFLVAPERRAGRLDGGAWDTATDYSGPLEPSVAHDLASPVGLPTGSLGGWLTRFLDRRAARPDGELWFDADADPRPVEPPPVVRVVDEPVEVPKGLAASAVGLPLLGLAVLGLRRRRR